MRSYESLSLNLRFELSHPSLPDPGSFMGLLSPVILILLGTVDRLGYQLSLGNSIAAQLIRNDLSGLAAMTAQ